MIEIEKRWELKGKIPVDKIKSKIFISQCYSSFNPDVRIRYIKDEDGKESYFHTVKYKTQDKNSRIEIEQPISKEIYEQIFKIIDKKPVCKNRYIIDLENNLQAEIDEFLDTGDIVIEVEFPDEQTMTEFIKPDWFGQEIKNKYSLNVQVFSKINKSSWIDYLDSYNKLN